MRTTAFESILKHLQESLEQDVISTITHIGFCFGVELVELLELKLKALLYSTVVKLGNALAEVVLGECGIHYVYMFQIQ